MIWAPWRNEQISIRMLAEMVFTKITSNHYGIYDDLITTSRGSGPERSGNAARVAVQRRQQYVTNDKVVANATGRHDLTLGGLSLALRDIAEIEGDTDAFIDTYQGRDLTNPHFVSEIALIAASRPRRGGFAPPRPVATVGAEPEFRATQVDGCPHRHA